jgi:hypothetical protein
MAFSKYLLTSAAVNLAKYKTISASLRHYLRKWSDYITAYLCLHLFTVLHVTTIYHIVLWSFSVRFVRQTNIWNHGIVFLEHQNVPLGKARCNRPTLEIGNILRTHRNYFFQSYAFLLLGRGL